MRLIRTKVNRLCAITLLEGPKIEHLSEEAYDVPVTSDATTTTKDYV
tara:strand:- start:44 stop:184 length:141 start_codon:yes stop_codon:yes gene_type:complete